jgi:hypothetical protein
MSRKTWADFRGAYESKIVPGLALNTRRIIREAFDQFEKIAKPHRVSAIKTDTIDGYASKRMLDPGAKPGSTLSPSTCNRELRHFGIKDRPRVGLSPRRAEVPSRPRAAADPSRHDGGTFCRDLR